MTDERARQKPPGAGDRTFASRQTAPWHAEALRIANQLRAPHINATKVEIAKAIVEHVSGAPTNTEIFRGGWEKRKTQANSRAA